MTETPGHEQPISLDQSGPRPRRRLKPLLVGVVVLVLLIHIVTSLAARTARAREAVRQQGIAVAGALSMANPALLTRGTADGAAAYFGRLTRNTYVAYIVFYDESGRARAASDAALTGETVTYKDVREVTVTRKSLLRTDADFDVLGPVFNDAGMRIGTVRVGMRYR